MNSEILTRAMGAIGDDLIAAADSDKVRLHFVRRRARRRKAAMIAVLAAAVGLILATALLTAGYISGGKKDPGSVDDNYDNEAAKPDASSEIFDWNGLRVTARLYSELAVPESGSETPDSSAGLTVLVIIIPQSANALDGAKAALTASGIGYYEKNGIVANLTPTQLAELKGDWVGECIFDLAE